MKNRPLLLNFIGPIQLLTLDFARRGEEGAHFQELIDTFNKVLTTMPQTYGQHGAEDPVAYLHYFRGGSDWYITERDTSDEQLQAFGQANLFGDPELGYISIQELIAHGVELDLHFVPTPLSQLQKP